jgi:excisionase family DNA binding protein
MDHERLLTIEEAARYLNVSKTSLRRWTNSGHLACHRVGVRGERRFAVSDLTAFLVSSAVVAIEAPAAAGDSRDVADAGIATLGDSPMTLIDAAAAAGGSRHVCSHFSSPDEWWRMFRPFVVHHAERGAPITYLHDTTTPELFSDLLRAEGFDPIELARRGLLDFVPAPQTYLPDGRFSVEGMLAFVESAILGHLARGHRTMLISGEMTWSLRGAPGSDGMIAYEERLNEVMARYPGVTINCQYDMERLGARIMLDSICVHPWVHAPQGLFPGFYRGCPALSYRSR